MKRFAFVAVVACLEVYAVTPAVRAGQITYNIQNYPAEQSGHTLSGTITTDGTIGALAGGNILSYTYTVDAGTGNAFTYSGTGANAVTGDVEASQTQITLAQPPVGTIPFQETNSLVLQPQPGPTALQWVRSESSFVNPPLTVSIAEYILENGDASNPVWNTGFANLGGDPWVLAAVSTPEPASLTLLGIGIAGMGLIGMIRRRRRTA